LVDGPPLVDYAVAFKENKTRTFKDIS